MEEKLLIIGIIAFIFAKISIFLKKKNIFDKTAVFAVWNTAFALIGGALVFYILNFMATNGINGGLSFKTASLIITATLAYAAYKFYKAGKADKKAIQKTFAFNLEWAETVYFAAFVAAFVMFFFAQAFRIPSGSMRNTLLEGDNLFVNKITYGIRLPLMDKKIIKFNPIKRGDIIVFAFPAETKEQVNCGEPQYGRDFVKRVIGLPGETVEVKNKQVFINGQPLPAEEYAIYDEHPREEIEIPATQEEYQELWENRELEKYAGLYLRDYFGPVVVPQGSYLAMGDNRDFSCDSRFWGPVPEKNIKGKAWFLHWPLSRMKIIK
ncbi:MAG: signal peptidase I [Elusimicrobiota bacterium]|nr:signal peptidase I [Elusimicrobiota bacterium]